MVDMMECSICHKMKKTNLLILSKNICEECEKQLVRSNADDPFYPLCKEGIKEILLSSQKA
mgnify:CR=1 FL=1